MSSDLGRCWLRQLATTEEDLEFFSIPSMTIAEIGRTNEFLSNLGSKWIEVAMFKLAEKMGDLFLYNRGEKIQMGEDKTHQWNQNSI